MTNESAGYSRWLLLTAVLIAVGSSPAVRAQAPAGDDGTQIAQVQKWAQECALECAAVMERWIEKGHISKKRLFSYLYYPLPNTDPPKFSTDYDARSDEEIQPILEQFLGRSAALDYVILVDKNGYVPTHNLKYSITLTGDHERDYKQNRTKRLLNDRVGLAAARNEAPFLLQRYTGEEGEVLAELSVPVRVDKARWGAIRIGFREGSPAPTPAPAPTP